MRACAAFGKTKVSGNPGEPAPQQARARALHRGMPALPAPRPQFREPLHPPVYAPPA